MAAQGAGEGASPRTCTTYCPGSDVLEDLGPDSSHIHERVYPYNTFTIYAASVQLSADCNQKEAGLSTLYPEECVLCNVRCGFCGAQTIQFLPIILSCYLWRRTASMSIHLVLRLYQQRARVTDTQKNVCA